MDIYKPMENLGHMNKSQAIEILEDIKKDNGWAMDRFYSLPEYQGKRSKPELENMAINIALDSLKEERPKGKWEITQGGNYLCNNCYTVSEREYDFCPNCGADMSEVEE